MGRTPEQPKPQQRAIAVGAIFAFCAFIFGCDINSNKAASKSKNTSTFTSANGTGSTSTSTTTTSTSTTTGRNILITWDSNRETGVNSSGGGYRVYYSTTNPVPIPGASVATVTYSSTTGTLTPVSKDITVTAAGTYYIKVVAFSSANTAGNTSTQISVVVP